MTYEYHPIYCETCGCTIGYASATEKTETNIYCYDCLENLLKTAEAIGCNQFPKIEEVVNSINEPYTYEQRRKWYWRIRSFFEDRLGE